MDTPHFLVSAPVKHPLGQSVMKETHVVHTGQINILPTITFILNGYNYLGRGLRQFKVFKDYIEHGMLKFYMWGPRNHFQLRNTVDFMV